MHNDNMKKWHQALSPRKKTEGHTDAPPARASRDDDTAVTEDLVHQMYL